MVYFAFKRLKLCSCGTLGCPFLSCGVCGNALFQVLDKEGQMYNPCSSWLADSKWDNITELDKLADFHGLMASFEQYPRDWNLWYTNSQPENAPLPGNVCV